jgi:hypothetical protein
MVKKHFTPKEARKTLPLVKKIVKDILDNSYQVRTIAESVGENPEENEEIIKLVEDINFFMKELEEIGCYYKDWNFSIGLVDFPSIFDKEEVYLCWKSDEEDIIYYHGIDEGFAGRKPIPKKYL